MGVLLPYRYFNPALYAGGGDIMPNRVLSLDFATGVYSWNGATTLSQAVNCVRADSQIALAQNADGTWSGFDPNTSRVGAGVGLLIELQASNYCKWNRDPANAVFETNNILIGDAGDNPIVGTQPLVVEVLAAGTTTWDVPTGVSNLIFVGALGAGGGGANGVTNTRGGGGGGGGAWAERSNVAVTPGSTLDVQIGAGASGDATFLKDSGGTTQVSAAAGGTATTNTAGAGGAAGASIGSLTRSGGAGGSGSNGTGNRGGGGGGGAANDATVGGANNNGRSGSGGNNLGGGGGGALGGGFTASSSAAAGVGGNGGSNISGSGDGAGGTTVAAATAGSDGGGGGGGLSGAGIDAAAGSSSTWTYTSGPFSVSFTGAGGGGGGGGLAGNGAIGGLGAGGGGGGSTAAGAGNGALGGDGTLIIVYGAANAARLTATGAGAYLRQAITAIAGIKTPSLLIRGQTVTGPLLLSQDDGATTTDIRSQLVNGVYRQAFAPNQSVENPVWRLDISDGDVVDIDLIGLEDNEFCTSPFPTTNALTIRKADTCTLKIADFPPFVTNNDLTLLTTVKPGRYGISTSGVETFGGWSWFDMDGFAPSSGTIDISGISGTTMTVTDTHGIVLEAHMGLSGAGVTPNTIITSQLSGPDGGAGDYRVSIIQTVGAGSPDLLVQDGYIGNAVKKPMPGLEQRIGVTVMGIALSYGFDPQHQDYVYFAWNRCAFTTRATDEAGIVALAGDIEFSTPRGSWADPANINQFLIGAQRWPAGANPLVGPVANLSIYNHYDQTGDVIAAWTGQPYP